MNSKLSHKPVATPWRSAVWIALVVAGCAGGGCVHRRFTVRTNPPGARVFVDEYEIGTSPVSHDFVYYGTRKIRLVKDGYETLTILQPIPTPWYDLPGIDFISENLVPTEIRDHRVLDFQMQPQVIVPTEQLMGRAEELRRSRNPNVPVGAIAPQGAVPQGSYPETTLPPGTVPPGTVPPGTLPPGMLPPGNVPPGAVQPWTGPNATAPGTIQPGTFPPNSYPPNTYPPGNAAPGNPGAAVPTLPTYPSTLPPPGSPGSGPSTLPSPPPSYQPRSYQPGY
jgi:PEGA domain